MKSILIGLALFTSAAFAGKVTVYDMKKISGEIQISVDPASLKSVSGDVDVLFMIDNSGSMSTYQDMLARNVDALIAPLQNLNINAGVITSDMVSGVDEIKWVNTSDAQWSDNLKTYLNAGIYGSGIETPLDSISAATVGAAASKNTDFFRVSTDLVIIMLTDAEDQSQITTADFLSQLTQFKGDLSHVAIHGIIIPTSQTSTTCLRDEYTTPVRLEEVIAATNGITLNLCNQSVWVAGLADIAADIQSRVGTPTDVYTLKLPVTPDLSTMSVVFGSLTLLEGDAEYGWTFTAPNNKMTFGNKIDWSTQAVDTKLMITFKPASWN